MAWDYKREEQQFPQIPEGDYRIRVKSADKAISKAGNDMLALQFDVSGSKQILYHYIVFLEDRPEITNRMLTSFFDSFPAINEGNFNMTTWLGKVGACHVKHDDDGRAKLSYFIKADKQNSLPPWKDVSGKEVNSDGFMKVSDDEYQEYQNLFNV